MSRQGLAGRSWSQRDCPLQGLSPLLAACFLGWWDRLVGEWGQTVPGATGVGPNHGRGHRVWGGTVQATGGVASPGLPTGELQRGDQEACGLSLLPRGGGHPRPPALPLLLGLWP